MYTPELRPLERKCTIVGWGVIALWVVLVALIIAGVPLSEFWMIIAVLASGMYVAFACGVRWASLAIEEKRLEKHTGALDDLMQAFMGKTDHKG